MTTAAEYDIDIYQGDRKEIIIGIREATIVDGEVIPGDYIDLSGKTLASEVREEIGGTVIVTWTCTADPDQITNKGKATMLLKPTETKLLIEDSYIYDLQVKSDADHITTYLFGAINVTHEVTDDA